MKTKKTLNKFWNRSPFFYRVRNFLLFRKINENQLSQISYNNYNPKTTIPNFYYDINQQIFKNQSQDLSDYDKALKIAIWLRDHIKGGKGLGKDSTETLKLMLEGGYGVCSDFCQIYNNFCVINDIKVREWGLKKVGSHLDGHALNEIYIEELNKWIAIDISKCIYFTKNESIPLSVVELFNTNYRQREVNVIKFNKNYSPNQKMIDKFYLSNNYIPFVIDKYINSRYDKFLKKFNSLPIPAIHGFLILINKSYNYKFIDDNSRKSNLELTQRHKTKTYILKLLDQFPDKIGYWLYHKIQLLTLKNENTYLKANLKSFDKIERVLKVQNIDLKNENILEIGSGWFPLMPYIFKVNCSVKHVFTFDINKHYNKKRILKTNKLFTKTLNQTSNKNLANFVKYHPYSDITQDSINFKPKLVYSRFVLEHISKSDLIDIHKHIYKNTPGDTKIMHLISPSDHRSYNDKSLSTYDFLKYSKTEWNNVQTKFDYHNRLRLPDYLKIFKETNYTVEYLKYDKVDRSSEKYMKFKELIIHSDFNNFDEDELLASSIIVLLGK